MCFCKEALPLTTSELPGRNDDTAPERKRTAINTGGYRGIKEGGGLGLLLEFNGSGQGSCFSTQIILLGFLLAALQRLSHRRSRPLRARGFQKMTEFEPYGPAAPTRVNYGGVINCKHRAESFARLCPEVEKDAKRSRLPNT